MHLTSGPAEFSAALAAATRTASGSMSLASARRRAALRGRDGENAGAAADVENTPRRSALENGIQREEAAFRGAVMAGPECRARVDLHRNAARRSSGPVMRSVQEEAPRCHGRQALQRLPHPILLHERNDTCGRLLQLLRSRQRVRFRPRSTEPLPSIPGPHRSR